MTSTKLKVATAVSVLGFGSLTLTFFFRRQLSHFFWKLKSNNIIKRNKSVYIISEAKKWDEISKSFCSEISSVSAVGFDCEWVQCHGSRRPVALLQLATHSGKCALFRLNLLKKDIPLSLKEILENDKIFKVGVSSDMDALYLLQDHNIRVRGWVDLRHLAVQNTITTKEFDGNITTKLGLKALASKYLGKDLNKDWRVRTADWEAQNLLNNQVNYAAEDALVGIQILLSLLKTLWASTAYWPPFRNQDWEAMTAEAVQHVCSPISEVKFSQRRFVDSDSSTQKCNGKILPAPAKPLKEFRLSYCVRKSPLYHNSQLWAPDGEPLCTCDPKKAIWYVEKGLGDLVSEEPLVVRLNFEPAGRPNREGTDGQFYLQERFNLCVVCGKDDSYIRKNIIPHEYRKHFPEILKSHQSHDVVLLCTGCHQLSNIRDNTLRYLLAKEFDAPIGFETDVKLSIDGQLKVVRSAGGALKKCRDQIPEERIRQLESVLREYFSVETLTDEHINKAAELNTQIMNDSYTPHGYKVYRHYEKIGLIQLEQRWRKWFLESMQPKFMPDKWSVSHNHKKLKFKMGKYTKEEKIWNDYKIALVGTDGEIDVPHIPTENSRVSSFNSLSSDEEFSKESTPEKACVHMM